MLMNNFHRSVVLMFNLLVARGERVVLFCETRLDPKFPPETHLIRLDKRESQSEPILISETRKLIGCRRCLNVTARQTG